MSSIINASVASNGIVSTADASGILLCQSNGVNTNSMAWVNFTGITTTTIKASYNVSSVTRNGTGDYTVAFTTAMTDANYATVFGDFGANGNPDALPFISAANLATYKIAASVRFLTNIASSQVVADSGSVSMVVFR